MKKVLWAFFLLITFQQISAQQYIIRFTHKSSTPYTLSNPSAYLSQKAIERRNRYAIPLDSTDLPVNPAYLDSLRSVSGVIILNASKWLNQVSVQVSNRDALQRINRFSFVQSSALIGSRIKKRDPNRENIASIKLFPFTYPKKVTEEAYNYGNSFAQVHLHNGEFLHNIGLRGQSMSIGMLDAGFYRYTSLQAFDSINENGQVLDTWDFVSRERNVADDHSHGMQCLSIIAANIPSTFVGTAPDASFYLYRTEDESSEYPVEEHNWVCGAERIDSAGGDVISSSLGYSTFDNATLNYTYADMDGDKTTAAKGADMAAKKGLLVVNSAGNEGGAAWKYIATPADGDSVLAVGAVNSNGQVGSFSSYGPSADGQIKPNVASVGVGTVIQNTNNSIGRGNGTSYACPNMAGLAACLWQGFKEFNNIKIIQALQQSGNNVTTPNNRIGFGIPDMKKAVLLLLKDFATSSATINGCKTTLTWTSKDAAGMKYEIERKLPGSAVFSKIGEQNSTSGRFNNHTYTFTDTLKNVQSGQVAYRILQIIDTVSQTYSADYVDTALVNFQSSCSLTNEINLFPNPAHSQITVQSTHERPMQNLQIIVYSADGKKVLVERKAKSSGIMNHIIYIPKLSTGKYFVSVYDKDTLLTTKEFIKL